MKRIALAAMLLVCAAEAHAAKRALNGKIAFTSDRDGNKEIYVMNADGSGQTRLTNNTAVDFEPAFSPDGTKIAFASDRDGNQEIYVMNADGTDPTRLTVVAAPDGEPAWSPDGSKIAFVSGRDGNAEIYVMRANGLNPVRLTTEPKADGGPAWSPDGQKIAFHSDRNADDITQIFVMNADGTNQVQLLSRPDTCVEPSFSPDGSKIVFSGFQGFQFVAVKICVVDADGSNFVRYATTFNAADQNPSFSPDGTKIIFDHLDGSKSIGIIDADGTNFQLITGGGNFEPSFQRAAPIETAGVYTPATGQWTLRNTHTSTEIVPDITFTFGGQPGDLPVAGDWNGDGQTDVGIFRNGTFLLAILRTKVLCVVCSPVTVAEQIDAIRFGHGDDLPVAGDWNGDGRDDLGVFHPGNGSSNSSFALRVPNGATFDILTRDFGSLGDLPVAGDWDGDGKDSFGVFVPGSVGSFVLTDDLTDPFSFPFGARGDRPLAGDWLGHFADRVGVLHGREVRLATKLFSPPDLIYRFGRDGDIPVAGHWTAIGSEASPPR